MLMLCAFLPLSGCTLSVYNNYRELERLQVIETVGFDAAQDGGVVLSISAGATPPAENRCGPQPRPSP